MQLAGASDLALFASFEQLFAVVPLRVLADKNDTNLPVPQSGGTYICPMTDGCCFNPGEDKDENPVVRMRPRGVIPRAALRQRVTLGAASPGCFVHALGASVCRMRHTPELAL